MAILFTVIIFFVLNGCLYYMKKIREFVGENNLSLLSVVALLAICFVLWLVSSNAILDFSLPVLVPVEHDGVERLGQMGDFFGGFLNPILSFFALLAVLYNIKLQRDEISEVIKESKTTNDIQERQAGIFKRQSFDSIYFNMVSALRYEIEHASFRVGASTLEGHQAFSMVCQKLRERIVPEKLGGLFSPNPVGLIEIFLQAIEFDYEVFFMTLYQALKMLDEADIFEQDLDGKTVALGFSLSPEDARVAYVFYMKRQYANVIKSMLTTEEVELLAAYCLLPEGKNLKKYVEKYSFLKPLAKVRTLFCVSIHDEFRALAFKRYEQVSEQEVMDSKPAPFTGWKAPFLRRN